MDACSMQLCIKQFLNGIFFYVFYVDIVQLNFFDTKGGIL